jgi:hypothetical protein
MPLKWICDNWWPLDLACSRPVMYTSMTARYRSREKISVTLTLMPSAITAVIAGSPATVAGILISTLARSTILNSSWAWAMVPVVS